MNLTLTTLNKCNPGDLVMILASFRTTFHTLDGEPLRCAVFPALKNKRKHSLDTYQALLPAYAGVVTYDGTFSETPIKFTPKIAPADEIAVYTPGWLPAHVLRTYSDIEDDPKVCDLVLFDADVDDIQLYGEYDAQYPGNTLVISLGTKFSEMESNTFLTAMLELLPTDGPSELWNDTIFKINATVKD